MYYLFYYVTFSQMDMHALSKCYLHCMCQINEMCVKHRHLLWLYYIENKASHVIHINSLTAVATKHNTNLLNVLLTRPLFYTISQNTGTTLHHLVHLTQTEIQVQQANIDRRQI